MMFPDSDFSSSRSDICDEGMSSASLISLLISLGVSGWRAPPSRIFLCSFGSVIVEGGSMSAEVMILAGVTGV